MDPNLIDTLFDCARRELSEILARVNKHLQQSNVNIHPRTHAILRNLLAINRHDPEYLSKFRKFTRIVAEAESRLAGRIMTDLHFYPDRDAAISTATQSAVPSGMNPSILLAFTDRPIQHDYLAEAGFDLRMIICHLHNIFQDHRCSLQHSSFTEHYVRGLQPGDDLDIPFEHLVPILLHETLHLVDPDIQEVCIVHPSRSTKAEDMNSLCGGHEACVALTQLASKPLANYNFKTVLLKHGQYYDCHYATEFGPFRNAQSLTRAIISIYLFLARPELDTCPEFGSRVIGRV